ncbi:hypothetical protein B0H14DRAFT_3139457 [Mycena olivaceomarginata]|nr:hypothetical protein B0H14DRAFT_3139457 [Mycena olivaceomarginata]
MLETTWCEDDDVPKAAVPDSSDIWPFQEMYKETAARDRAVGGMMCSGTLEGHKCSKVGLWMPRIVWRRVGGKPQGEASGKDLSTRGSRGLVVVEAKKCNTCDIGKFDLGNLRPALSSNSEETELLSIVNHIRGDHKFMPNGPVGNERTLGGDQARGRRGRSMRAAAIERRRERGRGQRVTSARAAGNERVWGGNRGRGGGAGGDAGGGHPTAREAGIESEGGRHRTRGRRATSARAGGIGREGEGSECKGAGNEHEWRSPRERARPVRARVGKEHEGKSEGIGNERAGAGIDR